MAGPQTVFITEDMAISDLPRVLKNTSLSNEFRLFIQRLVILAHEAPSNELYRSQLIEDLKSRGAAISNGAIKRHLVKLTATGIAVEREGLSYRKQKPVKLIDVQNLNRLIQFSADEDPAAGRRSQRMVDRQMELFREQGNTLEYRDDQIPITQALMGILPAAMRSSPHDSSGKDGEPISATYKLGRNESIQIEAFTAKRNGAEIAILSDMRVVRALNAMLLDEIRREGLNRSFANVREALEFAQEVANKLYRFDLHEIVRRIGLPPHKANLDQVRAIIQRIRTTTFKVDATDSPSFRERYFPDLDVSWAEFQFLTEFNVITEEDVRDDGLVVGYPERFYLVKFHSTMVMNLLMEQYVFTSHPGLFSDNSGLAQRYSDWTKAWIGVRNGGRGNERFVYLLDELHELVLPHPRKDNFCRDSLKLFKRQIEKGDLPESCSKKWSEEPGSKMLCWIYGYYYQIEFDKRKALEHSRKRKLRSKGNYPLVTIWRDAEDPYVGNESVYNMLRAEREDKKQQQLADSLEANQTDQLTCREYCLERDLRIVLDRAAPGVFADLSAEEIALNVSLFERHESNSDAQRTEDHWNYRWLGWMKNHLVQKNEQVGTSQAGRTRHRTVAEDLLDRSWAEN